MGHLVYTGYLILNDPPEYLGNEIRYEFRSCLVLRGEERGHPIKTSFL